jgi:hypothetical protein
LAPPFVVFAYLSMGVHFILKRIIIAARNSRKKKNEDEILMTQPRKRGMMSKIADAIVKKRNGFRNLKTFLN